MMNDLAEERVTLCDALDRILNKGAVLVAEVTISVADIDLIYVSLQALVTSIEGARSAMAREVGDVVAE